MDSHKEEAGILIHSFAAAHAVIAFLLANTVIGDTVILTGLTYAMIEILGGIYEVKVSPAKITLTPLFFEYLHSYIIAPDKLSIFLGKGELFIVSVAIGANAFGSLVVSSKVYCGFKIMVSAILMICIIISSLLFAVISIEQAQDIIKIQLISGIMFLLTFFSSACCILLADK